MPWTWFSTWFRRRRMRRPSGHWSWGPSAACASDGRSCRLPGIVSMKSISCAGCTPRGGSSCDLYDAIYGPSADVQRLLAEGPSINRCGDRLTVRGIKLYIDGALGSRGAALLAPYSDAPDTRGLTVNSEAALLPILTQALRRGLQVETHAIGDRGNRIMLDLYEKAFDSVPVKGRPIAAPRWRIEHAQILSPGDIPRFAQLG